MVIELDHSHDFDFEFGHWIVRHRRLKERLVNCAEWEEFNGTASTVAILGGVGNIEDNVIGLPAGAYGAIAIRSFDRVEGLWAIWWLDGRQPHQLDVPVVGSFRDGVGSFYAADALAGCPIRVRFLWLRTETPSPRWEQAMSRDNGDTWETNWTMDFERPPAFS